MCSSSPWWCWWFLHFLVGQCTASGYFELQLQSLRNARGELADGTCCDGTRNSAGVCTDQCETLFRVCLKEYQAVVSMEGPCTFGNISSSVLGGNSFSYPLETTVTRLKLPFDFAWTRSYTLILEAFDEDKSDVVDEGNLIDRTAHSGIILPGQDWHTITHTGATASITFRIRVVCDRHYYNTTCTKLCRPGNDDVLGHFTCDAHGDKVCLDGWMGKECETAICRQGCHAVHGSCQRPGECRCVYGWQGELCDQCIPYPGCQHGSCNGSPWQCVCDLNWGDILCDKDLNYCGRHFPCKNDGICRNTKPDEYECTCPKGFTGKNCEIAEHACSKNPCAHGGTCVDIINGFACNCPTGWTGETCLINIDECQSNPCLHGGTCEDRENGYECVCPPGWQGPHCQLDADECSGSPCANAYACRNLIGDYFCECQPGWTGKKCDINIDNCRGVICQNGAVCVDLVNDFNCACLPGFTGALCEVEINECASNPCQHGATCHDTQAAFQCQCAPGYTGLLCQIDVDPCSPNPCKQGASCFNVQGDFFCHCQDGWTGKDCSIPREQCTAQSCEVIDSCTISIPSEKRSNDSVDRFRLISSGVCGKNGICISQPNGGFSCACAPGYAGTYCHLNIDDCASNPCQNLGTCIDGVNSYQCICPEGWEGALCNINKNDCDPNPCRNNGRCIDITGEFLCQCVAGWKGKTCALRNGHCDRETCLNGGTCVDLGDTYSCRCPHGWEGNSCQFPSVHACDSNPCGNQGTCVNSGDSFTCLCQDGFEGATCEINVNDCNPHPCYNGGTCRDGINWYICQCAPGFSGPDCRVNINECASSPCTYGSTCIDEIAKFRCICPPGRTGDRCQSVIGQTPSPKSCEHNRRIFPDGMTWEHECNSCTCDNGKVRCTKIWCGPRNCLTHPNLTESAMECALDHTCVVQTQKMCLTPPCLPWGLCVPTVSVVSDATPPGADPSCVPNAAHLTTTCARMQLVFDMSKMPMGMSVEGICKSLRQLPALKRIVQRHTLYILCAMKEKQYDAIEITISTDTGGSDGRVDPVLQAAVDRVATMVSHKQTNSSALSSVIEIRVETSLASAAAPGQGYVIPVVCSMMGAMGILSIILLVLWHNKRQSTHRKHLQQLFYSDQKTNNENEENLRRYRNPLFDTTDKGGGTSKNVPTQELRDIDLEKYEKSPRRQLSRTDSPSADFNDYRENTPPIKTNLKKNINVQLDVQLSRVLASERDMIV
ncbi:protein jagged-1b-like [Pomacea canaliculata]|uniref:protein jagged-1b-like n=1 Tax=Pomacea canaliculata TaxID=400727 RepID=UPI000D72DD64|nr:protein jagged-1b-like [Pomacea canaliculata]